MSAFEVSDAHINALVSAALPGWEPDGRRTAERGAMSWHHGEIQWTGDMDEYRKAAAAARREVTWENAEQWGATLLAENRRSVNYRYEEDEIEAPYVFTRNPGPFDAVKMIKILRCYMYQACEHPGWKSSEAFSFCQAMQVHLTERLPGYGSAPWEIDNPAQVQARTEIPA